MTPPERAETLPLEYATELTMEMHLMRSECCEVAQELIGQSSLDEAGLEECAVLEEALARAHLILHGAISTVRKLRASRGVS